MINCPKTLIGLKNCPAHNTIPPWLFQNCTIPLITILLVLYTVHRLTPTTKVLSYSTPNNLVHSDVLSSLKSRGTLPFLFTSPKFYPSLGLQPACPALQNCLLAGDLSTLSLIFWNSGASVFVLWPQTYKLSLKTLSLFDTTFYLQHQTLCTAHCGCTIICVENQTISQGHRPCCFILPTTVIKVP